MRWFRGVALAAVLAGGPALAQTKPPADAPKDPPPAADRFAQPAPAPVPAEEAPAVARFRALLGPSFALSYRDAMPIDPATGSVRLRGVVLTRDGTRTGIEELTLDGLGEDRIGAASAREVSVIEPGGAVTRIARLELRGLALAPGAPDQPMLDSLRLEAVTAEGDLPVAIAEIALEDYGQGRPGRVTVSGLDLLAPQAGTVDRVRIGRVALRGLDLAGTVAALLAQQTPPRAAAGYALEVEAVAASLGDQPVGSLGALRIQGDPPAGGMEAGRLAVRELRLDAAPGLDAWLRRFGYPALVADLTGESRYDRAAGRLELTSLTLAGRDMGVLGLSLALNGVTPEAAESGDWERLRLAGLALRYLDQSLYARVVRDLARQSRMPEARLRETWASQAAAALAEGGAVPPALRPALAAVQRFLRGEARELELTARPPQPVALGEVPAVLLGGATAAQRALGLGATAR